MLILDGKGPFYYRDVRIMEYHAFVNSRLQIVEEILTDDGRRPVEINEWDELNDIEKYFALEHGLDIQHMRKDIIKMRFEDGATFSEVGKRLGISGSRASQIAAKAIKKLRHPNRAVFFRNGLETTWEIRKRFTDSDHLPEHLRSLPVAEMNMSARVRNSLIRHELDTLGQVYDMLLLRTEELMKFRNFGAGSMLELLNAMKEYGIDIEFVSVSDPHGKQFTAVKAKRGQDD